MRNTILLALLSCLILSSCSFSPCGFSKNQFIGNHENLVKAAKKNKKSRSTADWEQKDEAMKRMVEECYETYEKDMSSQEIADFWTGTGAYYYNRFGRGFLRELKQSESDITRALEKGLKKLDNEKEGFLEDWIKRKCR